MWIKSQRATVAGPATDVRPAAQADDHERCHRNQYGESRGELMKEANAVS